MRSKLTLTWLCAICISVAAFAQTREVKEVLHFDTDKFVLTDQHKQLLAGLIAGIPKDMDYEVTIAGHTDADASEAYNEQLSERRADAVERFLMDGAPDVCTMKIKTTHLGETQPVSANDNETGKQQNRRVEVTVTIKPFEIVVEEPIEALQDIQLLFDQLVSEPTVFMVDAGRDTILLGTQGTLLAYKGGTLTDEAGKIITSTVTLKLTEIYRYSDMIANNMSTASDGKILSTRGMFVLEGEQGSKKLKLAEPVLVMVPTDKAIDKDVKLFTGSRGHDHDMNWKLTGNDDRFWGGVTLGGVSGCFSDGGAGTTRCPFFWCKFTNLFKTKGKKVVPTTSANVIANKGIFANLTCDEFTALLQLYNIQTVDELKQVLFNKYGVSTLDGYLEALKLEKANLAEARMTEGNVNVNDLNYYVASIGQMNTAYNCDIFSTIPAEMMADVNVDLTPGIDKNVKVVIYNNRTALNLNASKTKYNIKAPKGAAAYIVAMQYTDNEAFLDIQKIVIGEKSSYSVELKKYSLEELKEQLKMLDSPPGFASR